MLIIRGALYSVIGHRYSPVTGGDRGLPGSQHLGGGWRNFLDCKGPGQHPTLAHGMAQASRETGLSRVSHYKAFSGVRSPALNYAEDCLGPWTEVERKCEK